MPLYLSINKCMLIHTHIPKLYAAGLNTFELYNFILPSLFFFYFYEGISIVKGNYDNIGSQYYQSVYSHKDYRSANKKYLPLIIILLFSLCTSAGLSPEAKFTSTGVE